MRKLSVSLLAIILIVSGSVWIFHNREIRIHWDSNYQESFNAYKRAAEDVTDGVMWFEPRYTDFEKARDSLKNTPMPYYGKKDRQRRKFMMDGLDNCANELNLRREMADTFNKATELTDMTISNASDPFRSAAYRQASLDLAKTSLDNAKEIQKLVEEEDNLIKNCSEKGSY